MRGDVEYSPVGEGLGLGLREFWLYGWLRTAAVVAAHVVALGFTIVITLLSRPGTSLFSWHPTCMSFAFCLCVTEGVLLLSAEGSPLCLRSRQGRVRVHWVLQALAGVAAATGLGFIVASRNASGLPHLSSWHGLLGAGTLAATACQALCGLVLLFPQALQGPSLGRLKLYHATCGLLAYLLATGTVLLGMFSDWFQGIIKGVVWYAFLPLPLFPALVVMNQITSAYLPKRKITT
ncbi:putative transmembrane reductase CYB561D1 [Amia ocellicauda]|uniref:putative transmembrane reductase CYB561D1 n=1 Tax=Amia ocellicauda TaxID=2972642 RepID=UPI003464E83F